MIPNLPTSQRINAAVGFSGKEKMIPQVVNKKVCEKKLTNKNRAKKSTCSQNVGSADEESPAQGI
jgi:hypothetical protein